MSYSSWSVVFGEQPSAAKWNILGTNDASFNDGTGIGTNAIAAASLSTGALYLGSASLTSNYTGAGDTSPHLVTGMTAAVTIPSGSRKTKITFFAHDVYTNSTGAVVTGTIWDGTVGSGTQLAAAKIDSVSATSPKNLFIMALVSPTAGAKTYNVGLATANGAATPTIEAAATTPAFLLVEAV